MRKRLAGIFYTFHSFRCIALKATFYLFPSKSLPLYKRIKPAIALDIFLSFGFYIALCSLAVEIFIYQRMAYLGLLVPLNLLFFVLKRFERRERIRRLMKPFCIYNINTGTAKRLEGKIDVFHLFISETGEVDEKFKNNQITKSKEALAWIDIQASRYNVSTEYNHTVIPDFSLPTAEIPSEKNDYLDLSSFQGNVMRHFKQAIEEVHKIDVTQSNSFLVIYLSSEIRSYAVPSYFVSKRDEALIEYCVLSAETEVGTHAHEILHLFGADDYYLESNQILMEYRQDKMGHCVMHDSFRPLDELVLSDRTAQNIGWL